MAPKNKDGSKTAAKAAVKGVKKTMADLKKQAEHNGRFEEAAAPALSPLRTGVLKKVVTKADKLSEEEKAFYTPPQF